MSLSLKESYDIEYDGTQNAAHIDLYADTSTDLTGVTTFDGIKLLPGSSALCIDTGDLYRITSGGTWYKQPSDNIFANCYTKAEIDAITAALTADIATKATPAQLLQGTIIPANSDLNTATYAAPGVYYCENAATAATLVNTPITYGGFVMVVYSSGNRFRLLMPTAAGTTTIYMQAITGGGTVFRNWYYANATQL